MLSQVASVIEGVLAGLRSVSGLRVVCQGGGSRHAIGVAEEARIVVLEREDCYKMSVS